MKFILSAILSSRENPGFKLFVISRNATLDVNRSLNSAQAPASSGGVHELSASTGELPKLRESTQISARRVKNGREEWCYPLSEADDCCRFSPSKNRRGASPSSSPLERIFYLDLLRTMTIRKLSSLLPRGIPTLPQPTFIPSTLSLLTPRDSPIDEPRRKKERPARTNRKMRIR